MPSRISVVVTEPEFRATRPLVTVKSPLSKLAIPFTKVEASWIVIVPPDSEALAIVRLPVAPLRSVTPVPVPSRSVSQIQAVLPGLRFMTWLAEQPLADRSANRIVPLFILAEVILSSSMVRPAVKLPLMSPAPGAAVVSVTSSAALVSPVLVKVTKLEPSDVLTTDSPAPTAKLTTSPAPIVSVLAPTVISKS